MSQGIPVPRCTRATSLGAFALLCVLLSGAAFPASAPAATAFVAAALASLGALGGLTAPRATTLALAVGAPILQGAPRLWGDVSEGPFLLAAALPTALGILAGRALREGRRASPLGAIAAAFLVVAGASAAASSVRGETLFLLLRGGAVPHVLNGLGMTAGERTREAVETFGTLGLLVAAFAAFAAFAREEGGASRLGGALAIGVSIGGSMLLLERAAGLALTEPRWRAIGRLSGLASDPNALGVGMAIAAVLLAGLAATNPGQPRHAAVAGTFLALVAQEPSGSRTGLLLLAVATATSAAGLARRNAEWRLRVARLATASLLAFGGLLLAAPRGGPPAAGGLLERLGATFSGATAEEIANHRFLFWREAVGTVLEAPLGGCGLGGFPFEVPLRAARRGTPLPATDGATNAVLDVAAECGLPALALALAGLAPLLSLALRSTLAATSASLSRAAGAAVVALAVASATGAHHRFPDVAIVAALAAAIVASSAGPMATRPSETRFPAALALLGLGGALLVPLPTASVEAAFPSGSWTGAHAPEGSRRWLGPRAFRKVLPGERRVSFTLENARPDGLAVVVRVDTGGAAAAVSLPNGEPRTLTVDVPDGAEAIRLGFDPVFVPRRLTGGADDRTLSVMLLGEAAAPGPR